MSKAESASLPDLLALRARTQADEPAYTFLSLRGSPEATLTFAELDGAARAVAARLSRRADRGERAILLFPPGLDFLVAFFGCLIAGIVAVPMNLPRRLGGRGPTAAIIADAQPRLALTNTRGATARPELADQFSGVDWLLIDDPAPDEPPPSPLPAIARGDLAFLQYTSGSTSDPKGIEVGHANLLDNLEMIRLALGNTRASTHVSWLPLYHDMGLILNVLQALYVGAHCVLLAPAAFMQRPMSWLRAISDYRAETAGGPNFGFDWCAGRIRPEQIEGIDLSCWQVAVNGAEPVRAETIERFVAAFEPYGFDRRTLFPAYGMAEATLLISGGGRRRGPVARVVSRAGLRTDRVAVPAADDDRQTLVGCGRALAGERIAIVSPDSLSCLPADQIGEIWVSGPNVCRGYWRNPVASDAAFRARLADEPGTVWLRTGDLGFLDLTGELFVTGRIKDVILIRGINHYPQDIEYTVEASHPALRQHGGVAFALVDPAGDERLVVVSEIERTTGMRVPASEIEASIREAVAEQHELAVHRIALIRPGSLPKTTSGKVQRSLTRQLFLADSLELWDKTAAVPASNS